jgi:3-phosphoshikimate 1-carboxyvinyltransferase
VIVQGRPLRGIRYLPPLPSAQVKSAVLLAGLDADGSTVVAESAATRDHTERALAALGAPVRIAEDGIAIERYQQEGFSGEVPGDPSSAAFLVAAAAITGSAIAVTGVGLNPSRLHFLRVFERMGVTTRCTEVTTSIGEPLGVIEVEASGEIVPIRVEAVEVPLIIDEIPALAAVATHATSDSWFLEVGELRVKETDRLGTVVAGLRGLGGVAAEEGPDLVVAGGGLAGGRADAAGDHRMAMALSVAALGAAGECRIDGVEAADVSFPGFLDAVRGLGASMEPV